MVKLPTYATIRALEIWARVEDGRKDEARKMVIADLEAGCADDQVQWIAAQMLKPQDRGRGAPKKSAPEYWQDIGAAFDAARETMTDLEARAVVSKRFGYSESHVRNCWKLYKAGRYAEE